MALTPLREKLAEMFEEEHGTDGIYSELFERIVRTDVVGMLFRVYQHAWDREGEMKVGISSESSGAAVGGPADSSLVWVVV